MQACIFELYIFKGNRTYESDGDGVRASAAVMCLKQHEGARTMRNCALH